METSHSIASRYKSLREELKRSMSASGKWAGLPALLDELHALRQQYEALAAATA